jgi:hypothetical protein
LPSGSCHSSRSATRRCPAGSDNANDHRAVAVYRGHGTRRGRLIEERHALVLEILAGKAIDIDDIALEGRVDDAFWT